MAPQLVCRGSSPDGPPQPLTGLPFRFAQVCDEPHPLLVKEMIQHCVNANIDEAYKVGLAPASLTRGEPLCARDFTSVVPLNSFFFLREGVSDERQRERKAGLT